MTKQEFKIMCINLRKQDLSLGEMIKILGKPKTSIYFHIKNIPLSNRKRRKIITLNTNRIIDFNHKRKGQITKPFTRIIAWNIKNVRLLAHLIFDGQITYSSCIYHNRSTFLLNQLKKDMSKIYSIEGKQIVHPISGVGRVSFHNVALSRHLKEKSQELLNLIKLLPLYLQKIFLRAFFDDEGSVYFIKNKRMVRGYQHSLKILTIIRKLLKNFTIESKIDQKYQEIVISRRKNLINFSKEISFSPGVRINGRRSNSIWRTDLEKRKILGPH